MALRSVGGGWLPAVILLGSGSVPGLTQESGQLGPGMWGDPVPIIAVSTVAELEAAVRSSGTGHRTIVIADGTYNLPRPLQVTGSRITFRGASGNREAVVLTGGMDEAGNGGSGFIFQVRGSHVRIQDLSVGRVRNHGIQVHGEAPGGGDRLHVRNVRFFDIREQMIKASWSERRPREQADEGLVEGCLFEYTKGHAYQSYCGGIDLHRGRNWIIRNNTFRHIAFPDGELTEGAIHAWNGSSGTLAEGNRIFNCDRGILYGMDPLPHAGGIIRTNFIQPSRDVGIYLCNAVGAKVTYNTILSPRAYPNAIEYRFPGTRAVEIVNNLCAGAITARDGATAIVRNNETEARLAWFRNPGEGDLHLSGQPRQIVGRAVSLPEAFVDIDGQPRPEGGGDLGADEQP